MVDGTKDWVVKASLAGFGLAVGSTLTTWLLTKIEAPTIAALRSQVSGGSSHSSHSSSGYTATGGI